MVKLLEANHVHLVRGDAVQELLDFCHFVGVGTVVVE